MDIIPQDDIIWIFRRSGVLKVDRSTLLNPNQVPLYLEVFDRSNGMQGNVVANSWHHFQDDILYICTNNGIAYLDTQNTYTNTAKPIVAITDISGDEEYSLTEDNTLLLTKDVQKIKISLAALTYNRASAYLQYQLEGFDHEPIYDTAAKLHDITYTNIPAGSYVLRLKAFNSDGLPSDELVLPIEKEPRFTETPWFPISIAAGAVCATALLAFWINYMHTKRIREQKKLYKSLTNQSISTFAGAIDAKDPYTNGHSFRVAEFSVKLAKQMGLSEDECERLYYIALLHDIGKIGIPDHILKKPGRLTDEEFAAIKQHPEIGASILENFTALEGVQEGALYHHERYDGNGYCRKLSGNHIPLFARIITVADSYDAMNSNRCYRKTLSTETIIQELEKGKGTQFDPEIAEIAIQILRKEQ